MDQKRVTIINTIPDFLQAQSLNSVRKKRVCAYARVSTDQEDQINSYKAQINEYTKLINENREWDFQGMYADEGLSGTSTKKRIQFLQMIDDARQGKIDLILTKSISRFARNTVDSLTIIRELRTHHTEIFFEKENLYSSDPKVDFMLTIFSSIAQEESRNISENIKWGFRKRFKEGIVHINTKRFLGYDKDSKGKIIVNDSEASIVKLIFNLYISGLSPREIANHLLQSQTKNGRGEVFWKPATIVSILTNEKYCGDAILQKRVTIDYLSHKSVKNTGQAPQYYITNNHEAIIPKEMFSIVQNLKKERSQQKNGSRFSNRYPLSGLVYCGQCHRKMNRQHYNPNTEYNRIVLSCKNTSEQKTECSNTPIDNTTLELISAEVIRHIHSLKPGIIENLVEMLSKNLEQTEIYEQVTQTEYKIIQTENEIKELIKLRISSSDEVDDHHYKEVFDIKKAELKRYKLERDSYEKTLVNTHINKERMVQIKLFLENSNHLLTKDTLSTIVKAIIVISPTEVIFCISDFNLGELEFEEHIDSYKSYLPILEDNYQTGPRTIRWRVIEIGDEANAN